MAHVVYISVGMGSTVHSSIALSHRLRDAGHRVSFISHRDIGDQVSAAQLPFYRLTSLRTFKLRADDDPMPPKSLRNIPQIVAWLHRRRQLRQESIERTELEQLIARLQPDLLLIDIECHFAVIATASLGLPRFLMMFWFSVFSQAGLPPLHTSALPATTTTERIRIRLSWIWLRLDTTAHRIRSRFGRKGIRAMLRPVPDGTVRPTDLRDIARSRGYDLDANTDQTQWLRPHVYKEPRILCLNVWEMEFPHTPHPNLEYVGPMIDKARREVLPDPETTATWEAFKRHRLSAAEDKRPLVYCSLGSYWSGNTRFLRAVIDVFERRSQWDLVMGLGGRTRPESLAPVPPNVVLLQWAPQMEVLALADCAVSHGGITTINECIRCNVPMVVYSTKHVDQNGCAARVEFHGLGVVGDKDRDRSEHIEQNIRRCIEEPSIRDRVARMREVFIDYEQRNSAVRLIEEAILKQRQPRQTD